MLSTRLPGQQSLLRVCASIQIRLVHRNQGISESRKPHQDNKSQGNGKERPPSNPPRTSLINELFPPVSRISNSEDDLESNLDALVSRRKGPDVLDLSADFPSFDDSFAEEISSSTGEDEAPQHGNSNVLVLSNASKSLTESDFMRLGAKGEHIEGWTSGITKVIPGRDQDGLQSLGHYFLVFSTPAAASAYRDQVIRLQALASMHTPTSVESPPMPVTGVLRNGEDINALIQSFTLVPASQKHPAIRHLKKPLRPRVQELINHGGHRVVQTRLPKSRGKVLLSLYGDITTSDIRMAILKDGRERNLEWNLWGHDDIVQIGAPKMEQVDTAKYTGLSHDKKHRPLGATKFVITFKDIMEARSFIRTWHRQPFPHQYDEGEPDGRSPLVNAELLW